MVTPSEPQQKEQRVPRFAKAPPPAEGADSQPQMDQDPEARFRYNEELLIKVKGKVKQPQPPNEAEKKWVTQKLQEEIDKRSERIKAIKQAQEEARSNRSTPSQPVQKLQALKQQFNTVLRQKQRLRDEQQHGTQDRESLRSELRVLKERLPRRLGPDGGDAELKELEFRLAHETNQLAEEKVMQARIKELNDARALVREQAVLEARIKEKSDAREALSAQIGALNTQLDSIAKLLDAEKQNLETQRSSQNLPDQNSLNEEKKECWEAIQVFKAKQKEVNAEFSDKYQEYIKLDKNYNNYVRNVKRQEYLERQKAREEREAAAQAEQVGQDAPLAGPASNTDASPLPPYAGDLLTLDQLLTCLRKLMPADEKGSAQQEEKRAVEVPPVPAGMKLMKKKDDEEDFLSVKKKPQQSKKGFAQESAPAAPKAQGETKKKLYHPLETLKTFMQYGIEVPQWSTELAATIQKVEAKKEYFVEKGKKEKEAKVNGINLDPLKESAPSSSQADKAAASSSSSSSSSAPAAEPAAPSTSSSKADEDPVSREAKGSTEQQVAETVANGPADAEKGGKRAAKKKGQIVDLTLCVDKASELVSVEMVC